MIKFNFNPHVRRKAHMVELGEAKRNKKHHIYIDSSY